MTPERWREVEAVYQSAMECEPEVRESHVTEACGDDQDLRREVESLLKLNDAPVLVDQPAWQAAGELLDNEPMLAAGTRLGPYRIEGLLGAGGMGHAYRARDTRLDRLVAIKVSKEEFSDRFQREARAIGALNHPNVCTLHDVGPNYLVMELVEGPTLADRIQAGPIPLEETLRIARQIVEALEAAHEHGIVHRDLKPGNIKIRPDGAVKVLDFGLAKRQTTDSSEPNQADSPSVILAATHTGMILGTAAYMSPEQARGLSVDKRSDIWAFGVVLYEMLVGKQLFEGATITDTLAAVLTTEPDWQAIPVEVRALLRACLERSPTRRLRDIGDAWRLLEKEPIPRAPRYRVLLGAALAILAILSSLGLWVWWRGLRPTASRAQAHLEVDLGPNVSLGSPFGPDAAISPDGTRLVFISQNRLFTRRLDQLRATELPGTEGARQPFFSPDGRWVAFFALSKLKKISIDGGGASVVCDAGIYPAGGHWSEDGSIVAALNGYGTLVRIPSSGGVPSKITELDLAKGEETHRWPQVLPGGKAVLFTAHKSRAGGFDDATIEVFSFADRRRKMLHTGGTFGRYLPTGHLTYINRGVLFAVPFDLDRLELRGVPARVLEPVGYSRRNGDGQFDCSATGTAVYRTSAAGGLMKIQWLYGSDKAEPLPVPPGEFAHAVLSSDGRRLAITIVEGPSREVWIYDWQRQTTSKLTSEGGFKSSPLWTPDGRYILYTAPGGIFWSRVDASAKPALLVKSNRMAWAWSITADGKRLLIQEGAGSDADLSTLPLESDSASLHAGSPEPFLQTPLAERFAAFSPDGRWVAYESNESGTSQVYVRPFHHEGSRRQISINGGLWPTWSRTRPELYFTTEEGRLMRAVYSAGRDTFTSEQPRLASETTLVNPWFGRNFDLSPDGKQVLALTPAEDDTLQMSRSHIMFLDNFFDELRRRVPGER